jgi:hypothetical protein
MLAAKINVDQTAGRNPRQIAERLPTKSASTEPPGAIPVVPSQSSQ